MVPDRRGSVENMGGPQELPEIFRTLNFLALAVCVLKLMCGVNRLSKILFVVVLAPGSFTFCHSAFF